MYNVHCQQKLTTTHTQDRSRQAEKKRMISVQFKEIRSSSK